VSAYSRVVGPSDDTGTRGLGLLRVRDFRLIFIAYGTTHVGDDLAIVALTLRVEELTDSGLLVAALLIADLVPRLLFAPLGGLLVDRLETVRLLVVASILQAGLAAALAFVEAVPGILALSFLLGTVASVSNPALFALVPVAAGEERVAEANARLEVARYAGGAIGPLLAGLLSAGLGTRLALLVDAATFLAVAACAVFLHVRRRPVPLAEGEASPRAREGIAFVRRDPVLLITFVVLALAVVFAAIDNVAEVFFAKDVLDAGDIGYGALLTAWILGMIVGATLTARRIPQEGLAPAIPLAAVAGGAAVVVAAAVATVPVALAMFVVGGAANGLENAGMRTLMHRRTPPHLQGRVFAAYAGLLSAAQIAALGLGGVLVTLAGARGSLLVAGTGSVLIGLAGILWYLALRRSVISREGGTQPR
jgi:MFS family permease